MTWNIDKFVIPGFLKNIESGILSPEIIFSDEIVVITVSRRAQLELLVKDVFHKHRFFIYLTSKAYLPVDYLHAPN